MTVIVVSLPAAPQTDNKKITSDKKLDDDIRFLIEGEL